MPRCPRQERVALLGGLLRVDVSFPDPDVDDSGVVDAADVRLIGAAEELGLVDPAFDLDWYVGVGGFVWDLGAWTGAAGVHVPIGLAFDLNDPAVSQLQFYEEAALNINIISNGFGWYGLALAIGGRYYF